MFTRPDPGERGGRIYLFIYYVYFFFYHLCIKFSIYLSFTEPTETRTETETEVHTEPLTAFCTVNPIPYRTINRTPYRSENRYRTVKRILYRERDTVIASNSTAPFSMKTVLWEQLQYASKHCHENNCVPFCSSLATDKGESTNKLVVFRHS